MVRPMVLEFQEDPTTQRLDLQYMFGDSFLVAPVLSTHKTITYYLPNGNWVDYWSKEIIHGGKWVTAQTSLDTLPLYVRGGSIIPMGPEMDFVDQKPLDPLTIEIYGPKETGELEILDEDRLPISVDYRMEGHFLEVFISETQGIVQIILYGVISKKARYENQLLSVQSINGGCMLQLDAGSGCKVVFELEID
jgi:alpha-D-xyloside xylohydrolase